MSLFHGIAACVLCITAFITPATTQTAPIVQSDSVTDSTIGIAGTDTTTRSEHPAEPSLSDTPTTSDSADGRIIAPRQPGDTSPQSASDSAATPSIVVEGVCIDSTTGEPPTDTTLSITIDSIRTPLTASGEFSRTVTTKNFYMVEVTSARYATVRQTVTRSPDKKNYFLTILLNAKQPGTHDSQLPPADTALIPWTISGTIIDSRFDLAIESDSITMLFDGDTAEVSDNGNFIITTRISGLHTMWVSIPKYQQVSQTIILTDSDKQPFVTIPTTITGRTITRREMTVTASSQPVHRTASVARIEIPRKELVRSTATMSDPMRALQTLPGVTAESDIAARPVIRGGDVLESRAFLDGVSLIQPYHFGGVRSTYNQFSLQGLTLYKSGFPAEFHNAQSGIIDAHTRIPSNEKPSIEAEINNMQYAAYLGIPLFKGKVGINGSVQGSYMDVMSKLEFKMISALSDDPSIDQQTKLINLPDYQDFSAGIAITPSPSLSILINEVHNTDRCRFSYGDSTYDITWTLADTTFTQQETYYSDRDTSWIKDAHPFGRDQIAPAVIGKPYLDIDTIMNYRSRYNILYAYTRFTPSDDHLFTLTTAWQKRWWDLDFPDMTELFDSTVYDVAINQYNFNLGWVYSGLRNHTVKAGLQIDYTHTLYTVNIVRLLHEMIINGSTNLNDFWGPVSGDTASVMTFSGLTKGYDMMSRLLVNYSGDRRCYNAGFYLHDSWDITERLHGDAGARVEYSSSDHATTISPRASVRYNLTEKNELIGSAGHYTQNNYDISAIALSKDLKPEKVWHGSVGCETRFLPWLSQKVDIYGKYYYDLLSEVLTPHTRKFSYLEYVNPPIFDGMPDSTELAQIEPFHLIEDSMTTYTSSYVNDGHGYAFGVEYMLRFDPADFWFGWISLSAGRSVRQRREGWRRHPFPLDRPLLISIQNFYRLPKKFEIGVKYRYMSGLPYTSTDMHGDTVSIGAFNDRRYAAYHRLDIRFSKGFSIRDAKGHFYIELWNSMNAPNLFALDSKSKKAVTYSTNLPTTYPFFGVDLSY